LIEGAPPLLTTPEAAGSRRFSSLELQLEIPKAATSDNTTTVQAMRTGVHNGLSGVFFFFACIS
jgi:hypothetical protein